MQGNPPSEQPPAKSVRCGDCHSTVNPTAQPAADARQPLSAEFYCPLCVTEVRLPLTCRHCGSKICPQCGTPLELVDELGLG